MLKSKPILAAILSATLVLPTLSVAEAGPRHGDGWRGGHGHGHWGHHRRPKHRKNNNGAALAAGIIGLAAGAVIIGALSQPSRAAPPAHYYPPARAPHPVYPAPVQNVRYEPWTPAWYDYCSAKYRSFRPATGTYTTYGGHQRFCR